MIAKLPAGGPQTANEAGEWRSRVLAALGPLLLPPLHIAALWHFWADYSRPVDRRFCSCSCWDTVFKGPYESGVASYKHLYFNATSAAAKIWFLVAGGAIALYECSARLLRLHSERDRLRNPMVVLFCASVFSHYYAWWVCLNYYNDDFYVQWNHQMFFTVTELLSTAVVMNLADKQNPVTSRKVFIIVGVALLHILAGGADQFFNNVVRGEGYSHQVIRDLGFMIPDILHVIIPLMAYDKARKEMMITRTHWIRDNAVRKDLTLMVIGVATGFLICALL